MKLTPADISLLVAIAEEEDGRHRIKFDDNGYSIQHPITDRLHGGSLFNCAYTWDMGDVGLRGVFFLDWDEELNEPVVGSAVLGEQAGDA